jgi:hypothetical protein
MNVLKALARLFSRPELMLLPAAPAPEQQKVVSIDPRIATIKNVASMRLNWKKVHDLDCTGLSPVRREWLQLLDVDMLFLVNRASYSQLRAHLSGRKTIRGLLAADADSVAAYKEALRPKASLFNVEGRGGGGGPKRSMGGMKI